MLTLLLTILMFAKGLAMDSRGTSFITAFPENIAFYYQKTFNQLKITTLHTNTRISVIDVANSNTTTEMCVKNGTILTFNFTKEVEEYQFVPSNKTFRITSNKNITVLSVSGWNGRFQSHVVQPEQNLGTVYAVPALNYTNVVASFNLAVSSNVAFLPFRLMIINAVDNDNRVSIKQVDQSGQTQVDIITLASYKLSQIQINGTVREISAEDTVAVILTHPCLDSTHCSCNMVVNQLKPSMSDDSLARFPVPPIFNVKQLLVTTDKPVKVTQGYFSEGGGVLVRNSTDILPLFPNLNNTLLISTSVYVSLRLIAPGLILDLMPTSMFSGCFLVDFNSSVSGALVIVNTSSANGVQMNDQPLPSNITWNVLNGTKYSWALVQGLQIGTIWHTKTTIGVYMIEGLDFNNVYGSPALAVNMDPDQNGCLVSPEMFFLGEDKMTWFKSRLYCMEKADQLARLLSKDSQDKMTLNMTLDEPMDGWISLRRSLYSTEWYWKNEDNFPPNVNFTYWADGQPEKPEKGLCASVFINPSKNFTWKSSRCCTENNPVCYNNPNYLTYNNTVIPQT